jgi:hypothetical protein
MGVNLVDQGYRGRYAVCCTVLEDAGHGPQLCLGGLMLSYPPQCGGPDVVGWSWDTVPHGQRNHTRWGVYDLVGNYDDDRFTLIEPAILHQIVDQDPSVDLDEGRFRTCCPEPVGGWRPIDPGTATREALDRAAELAQTVPGYCALWLDQNLPPGVVSEIDNDPLRIILNVATTGDPEALEQIIRTVWGGALCVSVGARADAELAAIQDAVSGTVGMISASRDGLAGRVDLTVIRATRQLQTHFDTEYGPGLVRVTGVLTPLD